MSPPPAAAPAAAPTADAAAIRALVVDAHVHGVDRGLKSLTGNDTKFEVQRLAGPALLKLLERICAIPATPPAPNAPRPRIVIEFHSGAAERVLLLEGRQLRFADTGQLVNPTGAVSLLASGQ